MAKSGHQSRVHIILSMPLTRGAENRMHLSIKGVSKSQELLSCLLPPVSRSGEHFVASAGWTNALPSQSVCPSCLIPAPVVSMALVFFTAFPFSLGWSRFLSGVFLRVGAWITDCGCLVWLIIVERYRSSEVAEGTCGVAHFSLLQVDSTGLYS